MESSPEIRARRLVEAARALTAQQLRDLSREVTRLAGWFGSKRRWVRVWEHAKRAADQAGYGDQVELLSNDSLLAVLQASADAAALKGRDVQRLNAELQSFGREQQDDEAVRRLHSITRKVLGIRASQRVGPSSLGVGGAALALLTSELLRAEEGEGVDAHNMLLRPWRHAVGPEPM